MIKNKLIGKVFRPKRKFTVYSFIFRKTAISNSCLFFLVFSNNLDLLVNSLNIVFWESKIFRKVVDLCIIEHAVISLAIKTPFKYYLDFNNQAMIIIMMFDTLVICWCFDRNGSFLTIMTPPLIKYSYAALLYAFEISTILNVKTI